MNFIFSGHIPVTFIAPARWLHCRSLKTAVKLKKERSFPLVFSRRSGIWHYFLLKHPRNQNPIATSLNIKNGKSQNSTEPSM
jgi:hypothetical protein